MPFVGRQRWCNLFRNRINLRFKSAFTVDFLRRLILFQQLALIVSMVEPLDFVDFRLRASHWVRSTDNFTIEVYLRLEFEFRFICIFASQIFSFFSLAGQVFLLPLFEILEGPLKDFNITSYLFAIWTNIWLKRAWVICIFKLDRSRSHAIDLASDLFFKPLWSIVVEPFSNSPSRVVIHIFNLGYLVRSLIDLWFEAIFELIEFILNAQLLHSFVFLLL